MTSRNQLPSWTVSAFESSGEADPVVRAGLLDGRDTSGGRTVIAAQGFGAWLDPFEIHRFALIARVLRARIVVVETPGFGPAGSRLLRSERRALRAGDFSPLAKRMFRTAMDLVDDVDDGRLSFLGYSLGASLAAAMATAATAQGWTVDELILVEPVGLRSWALPQLLNAAISESRWDTNYLSMNIAAISDPVEICDSGGWSRLDRWWDQCHFGLALRRGGLFAVLQGISQVGGRVVVVRADRSALTGPPVAGLVAALDVAELVVAGHHGFWHARPLVAAMLGRLGAVQGVDAVQRV